MEEEVAKRMALIMTEQQKQLAKAMEAAIKNALKGVDKANTALKKAELAVVKEQDAVNKIHAKAEKEGEKMAAAYFEDKQEEFKEAARTELLRLLTRKHLEDGKKPRDIADWLDISKTFIENIHAVVKRVAQSRPEKPKRLQLDGSPRLRYENDGRGGTVWFENYDTRFSMWWEFAGGDALVILAVPTRARWEAETQLPLLSRTEILTFIGEQIVVDHISGSGSFIIGENVITFYAD